MSILNKIDGLIDYINKEGIMSNKDDDAKENEDRITLGYWKICGLGNTARMLLVYGNIPFKNVMYEQKGADDNYSRAEWYDVKYSLGLDFPNLPYLIDNKNGIKLTESRAIYRYIARQFNIGCQSDPELAIADMVVSVISDQMKLFTGLCYGKYPEEKDDYLQNKLPKKFKLLNKFLENKKFVCGDNISYADFDLYYAIFANLKLDDKWIKNYENLEKFYNTMNELEGIKRWNKTEYSKLPLNNTVAKFR